MMSTQKDSVSQNPKKFCVLLEDDWEVQGNGLGNVASHQYLPSLFFMKLCKKLDVKISFMVEVMQQLIYQQTAHNDYNLTLQKHLWDDTILLMQSYGFDVQLHLHPQWNQARYQDGFFHLSNQWNIGMYDREFKVRAIKEGIKYLEDLIRPVNPEYKVVAFKGGSWGLQPSEDLLTALSQSGVSIVMGVRKNMKIDKIGLDYTGLEEERLPYYPQFSDINKVSTRKEDVVILPMQPYSPDVFTMVGLGWDAVRNKISKKDPVDHFYEEKIPEHIKTLSPLKSNQKLHFRYRPYNTHLKIGNQPFSYLKTSFKSVIDKLRDSPQPRIPIVVECHTKLFPGYYSDIEKFLVHIKEDYSDLVDFGDMTSFKKELVAHPELVKISRSAN